MILSRIVIRDIVLPVVEKIMREQKYYTGYGSGFIEDPRLEEFLQEEMRRHFGVIGANECQHLKEQLEEAKKNDPYAFEYLLKRLLDKYVKLSVKLRCAKKSEKGPPDRFSELRRTYPVLNYYQGESI
jgi:hypothetical protein